MPIKFLVLTAQHFQSAFDLATEVFSENSNLHKVLGIGLKEYRSYLLPSFKAMCAEGLSVVAIERDSDRVLGCLMVSGFHHHLKATAVKNVRFAPLAALTNELSRQYRQTRAINPGDAVLVDMGAVSSNALGMGIYQMMRRTAQTHAKQLGNRWVVGELSAASTQHVVLEKLGHKKVGEVRFSEFEYDGKFPFRSIKQPGSIIIAEGEL